MYNTGSYTSVHSTYCALRVIVVIISLNITVIIIIMIIKIIIIIIIIEAAIKHRNYVKLSTNIWILESHLTSTHLIQKYKKKCTYVVFSRSHTE